MPSCVFTLMNGAPCRRSATPNTTRCKQHVDMEPYTNCIRCGGMKSRRGDQCGTCFHNRPVKVAKIPAARCAYVMLKPGTTCVRNAVKGRTQCANHAAKKPHTLCCECMTPKLCATALCTKCPKGAIIHSRTSSIKHFRLNLAKHSSPPRPSRTTDISEVINME